MAKLAISNKPWNSNGGELLRSPDTNIFGGHVAPSGNALLPGQFPQPVSRPWIQPSVHEKPSSAKAMVCQVLVFWNTWGGVHPLRFFKYYTSVRNWDFMPYLSSHFATCPALLPSCLDRSGHTLKLLRLEKHQFKIWCNFSHRYFSIRPLFRVMEFLRRNMPLASGQLQIKSLSALKIRKTYVRSRCSLKFPLPVIFGFFSIVQHLYFCPSVSFKDVLVDGSWISLEHVLVLFHRSQAPVKC